MFFRHLAGKAKGSNVTTCCLATYVLTVAWVVQASFFDPEYLVASLSAQTVQAQKQDIRQ